MAGVGSAGYSPRLRFSSPFPYYHEVRRERASPGRVASGNPAGGGRRRSLHFRAQESRDRASGRDLTWGLCLRQSPRVRLLPSPIDLASSRGVPGLRPQSCSPQASGARTAARPNASYLSARPFSSGAALIGRAAAEPLGKAASHWSRPRVCSRRSGPPAT